MRPWFNQGILAGPPAFLEFDLDDGYFGTEAIPPLRPGERAVVRSDVWRAVPGAYRLAARADPTGLLQEGSEDDNARSFGFTVPGAEGFPDLEVRGPHLGPARPRAGERVESVTTVHNRGATATGPFVVRFHMGDLALEVLIKDLAPGAAREARALLGPVEAGDHALGVKADAAGQVAEASELNNAASTRAVVEPAPPAQYPALARTPPAMAEPEDPPPSPTEEPSLAQGNAGVTEPRPALTAPLAGLLLVLVVLGGVAAGRRRRA